MASKIQQASIVLQDRDLSFLRGLFESRLMTVAQAAAIHFDGRNEAAKKRLQKLKSAGFIRPRPRRVFEPEILTLARRGLSVLKEYGALTLYPQIPFTALVKRAAVKDSTLRHELEVMDVKAAFHSAVRNYRELSIGEFGTWPRLCEFETSSGHDKGSIFTVKPDGFLRIQEKESDDGVSEYSFFLEVDRSTETLATLTSRIAAYWSYFRSGGFAVRNGASAIDYKRYPFRVLVVLSTEERRNNIAESLLRLTPPILTQAWLSTFDDLVTNPFNPIWIRPIEFRDLADCQGNNLNRGPTLRSWKRDVARDAKVATAVTKHCLIVGSTLSKVP